MKIRDKFFLVFGLYILLTVTFGFFAYKELQTISKRLVLVETADDITNTFLEVRRYEKNFLLFKNQESLDELQKYLGTLKNTIDTIKAEIAQEIGSNNASMMKQSIAEYERYITMIAENFVAQEELEKLVRIKGRQVEQKLGTERLQEFHVLRRHEKNIMLYKNQDAYAEFKRVYDSSSLISQPPIKDYEALVTNLYRLYDAEQVSLENLRVTARYKIGRAHV
jgi:hypothetical protein